MERPGNPHRASDRTRFVRGIDSGIEIHPQSVLGPQHMLAGMHGHGLLLFYTKLRQQPDSRSSRLWPVWTPLSGEVADSGGKPAEIDEVVVGCIALMNTRKDRGDSAALPPDDPHSRTDRRIGDHRAHPPSSGTVGRGPSECARPVPTCRPSGPGNRSARRTENI